MKNILLLICTLFCTAISAQSGISPDLLEQAQRSKTPLLVLVTLQQQLNVDSLREAWTSNPVPLKKRPEILLTEMQKISRNSQQTLLQFLNDQNHDYQIHRSLSIVNMISMRADLETIIALGQHPIVRSVIADESNFGLIEPVATAPAASRSVDGHEPGLAVIGAPQMWALGYTGRGRTAYSVDTGIWPTHPAIKNQWKGNHLPLEETWLPWDRLTPGDKSSSHGTHTTGTILGLDTMNNDTIGVAFNASFIATDPVVTDLSQVRPLSDYVMVYEWSLNPDGDISTSHDVPDAINNSWGRVPGEGAQYCDEDVELIYGIMELAGIANLSSAGNEGPAPQTMTVPHNISINEVNSFTVGSVNGNVAGLPISDFSSRGPGMCGGDGSILIKPEVVAPGQSVRSCINQDEYGVYSGTSMACPHAVGAVLLLKEAFPYLPGITLLQALYDSAVDLGDEGEDNTYGNGIINVFDAYNLLIADGHEPVPPNNSTYDLVVTEIINPTNDAVCYNTVDPEISVKNAGTDTIYGINVFYGVVGEAFETFVYDDFIAPGTALNLALPEFALPFSGNIEFVVRAEMQQDTLELDDLNNQLITRFAVKEQVDVPFTETFEEPAFNGGLWHLNDPDNKKPWELFTASGANNSEQSARMNLYDYSPRQSQEDDLIGPRIVVPSEGALFLSFDVAYNKRNGPPIIDDTLEVWIGTSCELENMELIFKKGGTELSTYDVNTHDFVPDSATHWRQEIVALSDFMNEEVIIPVFRTINRQGNNLYIDNVSVHQNDPTRITEEEPLNVGLYPNPTNGTVNLQFSEIPSSLTTINIFDATGRLVKSREFSNAGKTIELDISDTGAGIYFVSISQDKSNTVLRLIIR